MNPRVFPLMAGKSMTKVASVLLASLLISTCGGTLRDHRPGSSEEEDMRAVLLAYEQAWNKHDESELAPLLDEGFIIWLWVHGERKLVATKGSYVFWLRDLFIRYRYLTFGKPEIWLRDDRATVSVPMTVDARAVRGTFRLIKSSGKWLIQEFEF
jgi:hypothetical protein